MHHYGWVFSLKLLVSLRTTMPYMADYWEGFYYPHLKRWTVTDCSPFECPGSNVGIYVQKGRPALSGSPIVHPTVHFMDINQGTSWGVFVMELCVKYRCTPYCFWSLLCGFWSGSYPRASNGTEDHWSLAILVKVFLKVSLLSICEV